MHRIRRRRGRVNGKFVASAVVAVLLLAASHSHALPVSGAAASTAPSPAASAAVAFARAQLGKPYVMTHAAPILAGLTATFTVLACCYAVPRLRRRRAARRAIRREDRAHRRALCRDGRRALEQAIRDQHKPDPW